MDRMSPVAGQIYKHFKDKMYQIIAVAIHSETKEKMIAYRALYGDNKLWCRPYDEFFSKVDRTKYPEIKQKIGISIA